MTRYDWLDMTCQDTFGDDDRHYVPWMLTASAHRRPARHRKGLHQYSGPLSWPIPPKGSCQPVPKKTTFQVCKSRYSLEWSRRMMKNVDESTSSVNFWRFGQLWLRWSWSWPLGVTWWKLFRVTLLAFRSAVSQYPLQEKCLQSVYQHIRRNMS